jgi:hypothetical protein
MKPTWVSFMPGCFSERNGGKKVAMFEYTTWDVARETSRAISKVLSEEDLGAALIALKSDRMDFSVISYKAFLL